MRLNQRFWVVERHVIETFSLSMLGPLRWAAQWLCFDCMLPEADSSRRWLLLEYNTFHRRSYFVNHGTRHVVVGRGDDSTRKFLVHVSTLGNSWQFGTSA